jgi:hypothetical protein
MDGGGNAPANRTARPGQTDLVQTLVGLLIVVVSISSAVVTWRAAEAAAKAADLDAQTRQASLLRDQRVSLHEADVAHDRRLAVIYTGHITTAEQFDAEEKVAQAQQERAVIRALQPLFILAAPEEGDDGEWVYDGEAALASAVKGDTELQGVAPRELEAETSSARAKRLELIAVDTGFIAALFILTLAQLARQRRGHDRIAATLAVTGTVLALGAAVMITTVGW